MTNFGVFMFATDYAIQPIELAKEVEARGFESLFFPEHTHIPSSRKTPRPGGGICRRSTGTRTIRSWR